MRVKKVSSDNWEGYLIFVTAKEKENKDIEDQINHYKTISSNIAVFVSGTKSIEQVIKDIIPMGD